MGLRRLARRPREGCAARAVAGRRYVPSVSRRPEQHSLRETARRNRRLREDPVGTRTGRAIERPRGEAPARRIEPTPRRHRHGARVQGGASSRHPATCDPYVDHVERSTVPLTWQDPLPWRVVDFDQRSLRFCRAPRSGWGRLPCWPGPRDACASKRATPRPTASSTPASTAIAVRSPWPSSRTAISASDMVQVRRGAGGTHAEASDRPDV